MDINNILHFIKEIPLFSIFQDEELDALVKGFQLKPASAGETIFDQGDAGDRFYIVYSGKVRIIQKTKDKKEINLGVRTRGDHFGETALITKKPRNAAARAVDDTTLLTLDSDIFDNYIFAKPELREHFDKFIHFTSINRFLKLCSGLSEVPPKDLQDLVRHFKSEFFKEGEALFRQGSMPDKFYIVKNGKIKIERWENKEKEIINYCREGDFFGEEALVDDNARYADAVCLTDCHLYSLSKEAFRELIKSSPNIEKILKDRIESHLRDKPPIPYKEIIKQELAGLKGIDVTGDTPEEEITPSTEEKKYFETLSSFYYRKVRFPFISQYDEMTCGTTCLMMIAKYYGKNFSSSRLRDLAHVDLSGSSLANLASAAEQLGFSTRALRLAYDDLRSVQLPAIVHWQGYHYIVVVGYPLDSAYHYCLCLP